jgi:hypothetical protein
MDKPQWTSRNGQAAMDKPQWTSRGGAALGPAWRGLDRSRRVSTVLRGDGPVLRAGHRLLAQDRLASTAPPAQHGRERQLNRRGSDVLTRRARSPRSAHRRIASPAESPLQHRQQGRAHQILRRRVAGAPASCCRAACAPSRSSRARRPTYRLNILAMRLTCPKLTVERLRPYLRRPNSLGAEMRPSQR